MLLLWTQLCSAGDQLSVERLAKQADAVAVVAVCFSAATPRLRIETVLLGESRDLQERLVGSQLLGPCLPSAEMLRAWLARDHGQTAARRLWERALEEGGYRSVVALRSADGLAPVCETEALSAKQWLSHPAHGEWRDRLDAAIAARQE